MNTSVFFGGGVACFAGCVVVRIGTRDVFTAGGAGSCCHSIRALAVLFLEQAATPLFVSPSGGNCFTGRLYYRYVRLAYVG